MIARNADDARAFHETMEGYDEEDARAELVCVLPLAEQAVRVRHSTFSSVTAHRQSGW